MSWLHRAWSLPIGLPYYLQGKMGMRFGVNLGFNLGSMWDQFGVDLESIWDRFGIDLGSIEVTCKPLISYLQTLS